MPAPTASRLNNRVWETGDEWTDRESGAVVDMMYRSPEWIEGELARVLDRYQAPLGLQYLSVAQREDVKAALRPGRMVRGIAGKGETAVSG